MEPYSVVPPGDGALEQQEPLLARDSFRVSLSSSRLQLLFDRWAAESSSSCTHAVSLPVLQQQTSILLLL